MYSARIYKQAYIYQMNYFRFLFILIVINFTKAGYCPTECQCSYNTVYCNSCLTSYYRYLLSDSSTCACKSGFIEKFLTSDFCCPDTCLTCYELGCATCNVGYTIVYNSSVGAYNCTCDTYYYSSNSSCLCLSYQYPTQYYQNDTKYCFKCPSACTCDATGCYSCPSSAYRTVIKTNLYYTCSCTSPLFQLSDGTCGYYTNCTITQDSTTYKITVDCTNNSQVINVAGTYICIPPYTASYNTCQCSGYNTFYSVPLNNSCNCQSFASPTLYYYYSYTCYACPKGCNCTNLGCIACVTTAYRTITSSYYCGCSTNFTQINGICYCLEPNYLTSTDSCRCGSESLPSSYYYDASTSTCNSCPPGCNCSALGCTACSSNVNRNVTNNSYNISTCYCVNHSTYSTISQKCYCSQNYYLSNSICQCNYYNNMTTLYYPDLDTDTCNSCPSQCSCNDSGCYSCPSSTYRNIVNNSQNISTCYCQAPFIQIFSKCYCAFTLNSTAGTCTCSDPYYQLSNSSCACKSITTPTKYYTDSGFCYNCPTDCLCSSLGCYYCGPNTLRRIITSAGYSTCPCQQNSALFNQVCTSCAYYQYYLNGICVNCTNCLTCTSQGCLTCPSNMYLSGTTCVCNNTLMTNVQGFCVCNAGYYLNTTQGCSACPYYCLQCTNNSYCISCTSGVNRQNNPASNCPCSTGYLEASTPQSYCCFQTCQSCNSSGCLSCYPATYRQVATNGSCVCISNFTEVSGTQVCACASGYYIEGSICRACPFNCLTCVFAIVNSSASVVCSSCDTSANRNNDSTCSCQGGFKQAYPIQSFCTPNYCASISKLCSVCNTPRIVASSGLSCKCLPGYYEDSYNQCVACSMTGCLECTSALNCTKCDESLNYYLVDTICYESHSSSTVILTQSTENLVAQFSFSTVSLNLINTSCSLSNVSVLYIPISTKNTNPQSFSLDVYSSQLLPYYVLQVSTANPSTYYHDLLMKVTFTLSSNTSSQYFNANIYVTRFYSSTQIRYQLLSSQIASFFFQICLLIILYCQHMLGYKHNELLFFLQTMFLLSFNIQDTSLSVIPFLYDLKYCCLIFVTNASLFISTAPAGYLQSSTGNYNVLTTDSNIVRNAAIPMTISFIILLSIFCSKLIYRLSYQSYANKIKPIKKYVYRTLEFVHKLTMYPVVFFSVQTLLNWNTGILISNNAFKSNCQILSIILLSLYLVFMVYQLLIEQTSTLYRLDLILQLPMQVAASIIIAVNYYNSKMLFILLVLFTKMVYTIIIRYIYLKKFPIKNIIRIIAMLFECASVICAYFVNSPLTISFMVFAIVANLTFTVYTLYTKRYKQVLVEKAEIYRDSKSQRDSTPSTDVQCL